MVNSRRIEFIDTAKALAIILMVSAHSIPPSVIIRFIAIFHMPLFFFFSGYFLKVPITKKEVWVLVRKRLKGLYWPYIKWSLLFLVLHNVFFSLSLYHSDYVYYGINENLYSLKDFVLHAVFILFTMDYHEQLLGGFWFLKTLLLGSILSFFSLYGLQFLGIRHRIAKWFLILFFWISTIILRRYNITLPILGSLYIIFFGALYYLMGSVFRDNENKLYFLFQSKIVVPLLIGLIFVAMCYHSLAMTSLPFYDIFFSPILAFMGIIIISYLSKKIEQTRWNNFFHYVGENTMTILALHLLSFKMVSLIKVWYFDLGIDHLAEFPVIYLHNELFWMAYTLVGCFVPLSVHWISVRVQEKL